MSFADDVVRAAEERLAELAAWEDRIGVNIRDGALPHIYRERIQVLAILNAATGRGPATGAPVVAPRSPITPTLPPEIAAAELHDEAEGWSHVAFVLVNRQPELHYYGHPYVLSAGGVRW